MEMTLGTLHRVLPIEQLYQRSELLRWQNQTLLIAALEILIEEVAANTVPHQALPVVEELRYALTKRTAHIVQRYLLTLSLEELCVLIVEMTSAGFNADQAYHYLRHLPVHYHNGVYALAAAGTEPTTPRPLHVTGRIRFKLPAFIAQTLGITEKPTS